jgi:hypothetical protein
MLVADGAINYRSTSGIEFLALGLATISLDSAIQTAYPEALGIPGDLLDWEKTKVSLKKALDEPWSVERSRLALRWLFGAYIESSVEIAESLNEHEMASTYLTIKLASRLTTAHNAIKVTSWKHLAKAFLRSVIATGTGTAKQVGIKIGSRNVKVHSLSQMASVESWLVNRKIKRKLAGNDDQLVWEWLASGSGLLSLTHYEELGSLRHLKEALAKEIQ